MYIVAKVVFSLLLTTFAANAFLFPDLKLKRSGEYTIIAYTRGGQTTARGPDPARQHFLSGPPTHFSRSTQFFRKVKVLKIRPQEEFLVLLSHLLYIPVCIIRIYLGLRLEFWGN